MRRLNQGGVGRLLRAIAGLVGTLIVLLTTALQYTVLRHRQSGSLAAENLFLRKQLALFQEREVKPRRADDATRAALVWLAKAFNWRGALVIVKPATLIGWHPKGFRLFWKLKSRAVRPGLPAELKTLIRRMAVENVTWGNRRAGTSPRRALPPTTR